MADKFHVVRIVAYAGVGAVYELSQAGAGGQAALKLTSSSLTVHRCMIAALFGGSEVEPEVFGDSSIIKRVDPFEFLGAPGPNFQGDFLVSRIATQRFQAEEHLEVFVTKLGDNVEKAFNVSDPHFQQIVVAAFSAGPKRGVPLDLVLAADEIVEIRIGGIAGPFKDLPVAVGATDTPVA